MMKTNNPLRLLAMLFVATGLLIFAGCSASENGHNDMCPIDIIGLSLDDPTRISGTWRWVEGRLDDCSSSTHRDDGSLRFRITGDSVFVIEGTFEGTKAHKLVVREGTLGGFFLDMSGYVVLLSPGDTLIVDARYRDLGQGLFVRE